MANLRANRITSTEVFETTGSVQFDGSGDYLSLASSDNFGFETGDFTIELWVNMQSTWSDSVGIFGLGDSYGISSFASRLSFWRNGGNVYSFSETLTQNIWTHIAICRFNGKTNLFLNGVLKNGIFSINTTDPVNLGTSQYIEIGRHLDANKSFQGHISNVRILKGQALYTENFTPPTRELEVIPNTVLLACQSTTNAAEEKTGKTITVNGNAVANELTPGLLTNIVKSGGSSAITGSVEFDGTGDYLTLNGENDFAFGTGDFTVEMWVYHSVQDVQVVYYDSRPSSGNGAYPALYKTNTNYLAYYVNSSTQITGSTAIVQNSWNHIVLCRNGTSTRLFLNGIQQGATWTDTTNYINGASRPTIGADGNNPAISPTTVMRGFISNLRIIKGTALYTSDFIPPTRNLTKLPGTVLLCCQDSNDPTTEATGKTITGYGDLQKADGVELVTNGTFSDGTTGWSQVSSPATFEVTGGRLHIVANSNGDGAEQNINLVVGAIYTLKFDYEVSTASVFDGNGIQWATPYGGVVTGSGSIEYTFTATTVSNDIEFIEGGPSDNADFYIDNVSLTLAETRNGASDFTPSVGSDGSVEFAGPTTINTENYFYLPTGPTEQRDSDGGHRGLFMGGQAGSQIEYITISNQSNALDFGDLSVNRTANTAASSSSRGISAGGYSAPASSDVIDYVTIASTGDAQDFGDLTEARRNLCGLSNSTRGIFGGGANPGLSNTIDYITIPSAGSAQDFGNLTTTLVNLSACSSPTRGIIGGGESPGTVNTIQYITIPSKGDAQDFGDLTGVRSRMGSCSSNTRGLFGSGRTPAQVNTIDYVTIASTGNAQDFGDVTDARESLDGTSDNTRGIFAGGYPNTNTNLIEFVIIQSMGNAFDFGDLITPTREFGACSNGHGGLG